jgi:hypothetical protein
MSKETPADDPHQKTDEGSLKQTDQPWKGPPEKEQKPSDHTPDLEKARIPHALRERDDGGEQAGGRQRPEEARLRNAPS